MQYSQLFQRCWSASLGVCSRSPESNLRYRGESTHLYFHYYYSNHHHHHHHHRFYYCLQSNSQLPQRNWNDYINVKTVFVIQGEKGDQGIKGRNGKNGEKVGKFFIFTSNLCQILGKQLTLQVKKNSRNRIVKSKWAALSQNCSSHIVFCSETDL